MFQIWIVSGVARLKDCLVYAHIMLVLWTCYENSPF